LAALLAADIINTLPAGDQLGFIVVAEHGLEAKYHYCSQA
jgi:hypothetical protein